MKKSIYLLSLSLAFVFSMVFLSSFVLDTSAKTITVEVSDNSCTLHVSNSYGSDAKSVKVSTDVSGGMSCVGGRSFYTDKSGNVTLNWSSGCSLKKIYIDGRGYDVNFKDGGSYSITMR